MDADDRAVEYPVSLEGFAPGSYKVSLIIDEYRYDSSVCVTV